MTWQSVASERVQLRVGDLEPVDFEALARCAITAWDIETSGLDYAQDRIGTVQIADDGGHKWLIQIDEDRRPDLLCAVLSSAEPRKIFHFAPFDLGFMRSHWGVRAQNVACTKVLHRLVEPHAESHSLQKILASELQVSISKDDRVRRSDWSVDALSAAQLEYAVRDVEFLIPLYRALMDRAERQGVLRLAERSFEYLPVRAETEFLGLGDLFAY